VVDRVQTDAESRLERPAAAQQQRVEGAVERDEGRGRRRDGAGPAPGDGQKAGERGNSTRPVTPAEVEGR